MTACACLHALLPALVLQLRQHDGGEGVAVVRQQVISQALAERAPGEDGLGEVWSHLKGDKRSDCLLVLQLRDEGMVRV